MAIQRLENYIFPVFTQKYKTDMQRTKRICNITIKMTKTLAKACRLAKVKCLLTWYSARASFITWMVDQGYLPYVVAEMAGNSPIVIYKHKCYGEYLLPILSNKHTAIEQQTGKIKRLTELTNLALKRVAAILRLEGEITMSMTRRIYIELMLCNNVPMEHCAFLTPYLDTTKSC